MWRRFGKSLNPTEEVPLHDDGESTEAWIDEVVVRFCQSHNLAARAVQALTKEAAD